MKIIRNWPINSEKNIEVVLTSDRKFNLLVNGKIMFDEGFEWLQHESVKEDIITVCLNNKWNYINIITCTYVSKEWFDSVDAWKEGHKFGCVAKMFNKNTKYNLIDKKGDIILNIWVDGISIFGYYPIIKYNGKYNFVNEDGNFISPTWFDNVRPFSNRRGVMLAVINCNGKYNVINNKCEYISKQWFDDIKSSPSFCESGSNALYEGYEVINNRHDGKQYNYLLPNGKLLSDEWFVSFSSVQPIGYVVTKANGKVNVITDEGELISEEWFDNITYEWWGFTRCEYIHPDKTFVELNGKKFKIVYDDQIHKYVVLR